MKHKPLSDLELYEVLTACYPERFSGDDSDADYDKAQDLADELGGIDGETDLSGAALIADLLGRVAMLTPTIELGREKQEHHAFLKPCGKMFLAVVKRAAEQGEGA